MTARAWQVDDLRAALPRPTAESDKYARGVVGVLAGSATYSGAAVLAVDAYLEQQWGFLLLEGVWTIVSAWGLAMRARGRATGPRAAA